jgi:uncharacterized protein YndB with AHSA1/START domain
VEEYGSDFRVGGRELSRFRYQGGPEIVNETVYQDIVPERRIIIAYWMTIGGQRISVSQATMEFEPAGAGIRLVFTEHRGDQGVPGQGPGDELPDHGGGPGGAVVLLGEPIDQATNVGREKV